MKLRELERDLEELRARMAEPSTAPDAFGVVAEVFADELRSLLGDTLPDPAAVRRAVRLAVAQQDTQALLPGLGGWVEVFRTRMLLPESEVRARALSTATLERDLAVCDLMGNPGRGLRCGRFEHDSLTEAFELGD